MGRLGHRGGVRRRPLHDGRGGASLGGARPSFLACGAGRKPDRTASSPPQKRPRRTTWGTRGAPGTELQAGRGSRVFRSSGEGGGVQESTSDAKGSGAYGRGSRQRRALSQDRGDTRDEIFLVFCPRCLAPLRRSPPRVASNPTRALESRHTGSGGPAAVQRVRPLLPRPRASAGAARPEARSGWCAKDREMSL